MKVLKEELNSNLKNILIASSSIELVTSLHVLSVPSHHYNCINWYYDIINHIDKNLYEKIVSFGNRYVNWTFVMDIIDLLLPISEYDGVYFKDDFKNIITKLRTMSDFDFTYIFLGGTLIHDISVVEKLLESPDDIDSYALNEVYQFISKPNVIYFIKNIHKTKEEIIQIMETYYNNYFLSTWNSTYTIYKSALYKTKKSLDSKNQFEFLSSLHKDLSIEGCNLFMHKEVTFKVSIKDIKETRVILSLFSFPHLMINIFENGISIYKNLLSPSTLTIFEEMSLSIKTLGDANRLAIIKVLLHNSLTNSSLAQLLNITPASVSQHIKFLKEQDLLISYRNKNNIFYSVNKDKLSAFIFNIKDFLEL